MKKSKIKNIAFAFGAMVLSTVATTVPAMSNFTAPKGQTAITAQAAEIKEYVIGTQYNLKQEEGVYTCIYSPSGLVYDDKVLALNEAGEWTIRYIKGSQVTEEKILVYKNTYEFSSDKSSVAMVEHDKWGEGVRIEIAKNSTFKYNEIIDLNNLSTGNELFQLDIMPSVKGVKECTNFNIYLTDIYDENNWVRFTFSDSSPKDGGNINRSYLNLGHSGDPNKHIGAYGFTTFDKTDPATLPRRDYTVIKYENRKGYGAHLDLSFGGTSSNIDSTTKEAKPIIIYYDTEEQRIDCNAMYTRGNRYNGIDAYGWIGGTQEAGGKLQYLPDTTARNEAKKNGPITERKWITDPSMFNFVCDLDNVDYSHTTFNGTTSGFSSAFKGFSCNKVYMSIECENFTAPSAGIWFKKIGDTDITTTKSYDGEDPVISVDMPKDIPMGCVNLPYPIFNALSSDDFMGIGNPNVKVFYTYKNNRLNRVPIINGAFIPEKAGEYMLVYSTKDGFGHEAEQTVMVTIKNTSEVKPPEIELLENYQASYEIGKKIDVIPAEVACYTGEENLNVKIFCGTEEIFTNVESFIPEKLGTYKVVYESVDYLNRITRVEKSFTVENVARPQIKENYTIPVGYINGATYMLPDMQAWVYDNGEKQEAVREIYVKDKAGERKLTDLQYVANGDASVSFKYVFLSLVDSEYNVSKEFVVPTINAEKEGDYLPLDKYFITDNAQATLTQAGIVLSMENTDSVVAFINRVSAKSLAVRMKFATENEQLCNNASAIKVIFQDTLYAERTVEMIFEKTETQNKSTIYVNGHNIGLSSFDFSTPNSILAYEFNIDEKKLSIDKIFYELVDYANGTAFEGFTNNQVYVKISMQGIEDAVATPSKLVLMELSNQTFGQLDMDTQRPVVSFKGAYNSSYDYDTVLSTLEVFCVDVLNVNIQATYRLVGPNGKTVVSVDNVPLTGIDASKSHSFRLTQVGRYRFIYEIKDGAMTSYEQMSFNCIDKQKPTVELSETTITCKKGELVELPTALISDNNSAVDTLHAYVIYLSPTGKNFLIESTVKDGVISAKHIFDEVGTWTIKYFVYDENYNLEIVYLTCIVEN